MLRSIKQLCAVIAASFLLVAPAQAGPTPPPPPPPPQPSPPLPSQTNLLGRDINGNAVAGNDASSVFLYDSHLNITWLRDANVNGRKYWDAANTWAAGYSIGIFDDWRLPTALNADGTGPCDGYDCTDSEMGHLWYTVLGNTTGSNTNAGEFLNMQSNGYWSGTEYAPDTVVRAWHFNTYGGDQKAVNKFSQLYAMAVRPGDVLAAQVPEPESLLLALTALGALALVRRRRAVEASAR